MNTIKIILEVFECVLLFTSISLNIYLFLRLSKKEEKSNE